MGKHSLVQYIIKKKNHPLNNYIGSLVLLNDDDKVTVLTLERWTRHIVNSVQKVIGNDSITLDNISILSFSKLDSLNNKKI